MCYRLVRGQEGPQRPRLDSEQFRSGPRICRPPRGRLNVRKTARKGSVACWRSHKGHPLALAPDVLIGGIGPTTQAFQEATRTLPIVFAQAVDPVGLGTVRSMARPGGNATGFTQFEYGL